jgi:hypothetical protein
MTGTAGIRTAALALVVLTQPVSAQRWGQGYVGAIAGATLSDTYGVVDSDTRWGGTAGVIVGYRTAKWAAISLEPAWIQKGGSGGPYDINLDYVEVPVTIGAVARSKDDRWRFSGYFGLAAAFKVGCSSNVVALDCETASGTEWSTPLGVRVFRLTGDATAVGFDLRYALPLSGAWETQILDNRTWSFRLAVIQAVGNER